MLTRLARLAAKLLGGAALVAAVSAAAPTFWQTATEADFLRGEVEQLAIDAGVDFPNIAAAIATLAFFSRTAAAGQVLLDVALSINEQKTGQHRLITAEGPDAEIRLEGQMRLIVTPRVTEDGHIDEAEFRAFTCDNARSLWPAIAARVA